MIYRSEPAASLSSRDQERESIVVEFERSLSSSGIEALDGLLGGGIEQGSSTLILGPAGTGKSLITVQFVAAAAARGENRQCSCSTKSWDFFSREPG